MTNQAQPFMNARMGLGTWYMGSNRAERANEVAALRAGIDAGVRVIDTAEMYASGGAEEVTGEAIAGQCDQLYVVTKELPSNASRAGTISACERRLRRMETDYADLYLLHWQGSHPLAETIDAFETLRERGLIRAWGVSNFDADDMRDLFGNVARGSACAVNQVYYSLSAREIALDAADLRMLDALFPPPSGKTHLRIV